MSWNHRIIESKVDENGEKIAWFAVHEVYYKDKDGGEDYGNISGWTKTPIDIAAESIDDLKWLVGRIQNALGKPVLNLEILKKNANT